MHSANYTSDKTFARALSDLQTSVGCILIVQYYGQQALSNHKKLAMIHQDQAA